MIPLTLRRRRRLKFLCRLIVRLAVDPAFEFNADFREEVENGGMVISAVNDEHGLVEVVELPSHPFFIACQYHPEFQSRPNSAHPLFSGLVAAALEAQQA